ncbi:putative Lactamase_B domain-containing protein [Candidatus Hydrogenisulfobacillus filiaventi]|uniref:Putative Lactamase_B domain-containing protein n=1 Tax=Candidatus Hydrogenisulfobacillus filiaventi TaxID=2707344 RepID=A0A6F8ZDA0_9FIRM|nr:putative Lactamase_B domain-containing protein [Candidatus Hydrogenisulfobacillus filiaventi]
MPAGWQELTPGVWVAASALYALHSVLLRTRSGWVAVDPGFLPEEVAALARQARERAGAEPILTVLTHSDFDHLAGVGSLGEALAVSSHWDVSNEAESWEELTQFDQKYYLQRPWGEQPPSLAGARRWRNGDADPEGVYGFWMPGHTWDSLALVVPALGLLVAGDYLSEREFPLVTASWTAYGRSLDRFAAVIDTFDLQWLVPGHGQPARGRAALRERVAWARDYWERVTALAEAAVTAGRPWQALAAEAVPFGGRPLPAALTEEHRANLRRAWEARRWGDPPGPDPQEV